MNNERISKCSSGKKGNLLPLCCPRTVRAMGAVASVAPAPLNSLLANIDQLRIFLSIHKIDILAINETKLDSSITSNEIHISGYDIVRRDRPHNGRHGGGICIFIKTNLI